MSNLGLYKSLEREGIDYEQTAVGDKYVAENMMENNYSIGGEQSGHIIFSRYSATGDGILTSLMIMEACVDQKATPKGGGFCDGRSPLFSGCNTWLIPRFMWLNYS